MENKERWLVSQAELETWLDGISNARTLIAPIQKSGLVLYRPVVNSSEISWSGEFPEPTGAIRPLMSLKEIFFPSTERLFTIQKTGQEIHLNETFPDWEAVVFGVRPCDPRGVKLLDSVFLNTDPVDTFYARRRSNTTLIGLACRQPGPSCFCTSVGIAPDNGQDVDIMLFDTSEGYLVEAVTGKGRFLIPGGEWKATTEVPDHDHKDGQFSFPEQNIWPKHFNDEYWMKISERCLSCRACAFICPTCRCFIIRDEKLATGSFERIRCWDACTGENYRRLAGGHKPRSEKGERLRNRFYCKFYYYPDQYGLNAASACTGCGRCIDVCPVGVDITEVLLDMEKFG